MMFYAVRKRLLLIFFLFAAIHFAAGYSHGKQTPSIAIDQLKLQNQSPELTIIISENRPVNKELIQEHMKAYIDGQEVTVKEVSLHPAPPQSDEAEMSVIWDVSKSIRRTAWQSGQKIALNLLEKIPPHVDMALTSVGENVQDLSGYTNDRALLKEKLLSLKPTGKQTLLNESIYYAAENLAVAIQGKKAILLFTDGIDDGSYLSENDCVEKVRQEGIFIIVFDLGKKTGRGSSYLKRLAKVSNGYYYDNRNPDLVKMLEEFFRVARTIYSIKFDHAGLKKEGLHELKAVLYEPYSSDIKAETIRQFYVPADSNVGWSSVINFANLILLLFLLGGGIAALIWYVPRPQEKPPMTASETGIALPELGALRDQVRRLQEEAGVLEASLLNYGDEREEKINRWKAVSFDLAKKAVVVLKTCWLERADPLGQIIYDELVSNLKTTGVEEIAPKPGEVIDENDRRYLIKQKTGVAPYRVSKVIYPGYYFRPRLGRSEGPKDKILLDPAHLELAGTGDTAEQSD